MNKQIIKYCNQVLAKDQSGLSIDHINCVIKLTEQILTTESNANMEVALIAASKNIEQHTWFTPIEGQVVQDADRLDAIGIGRAFYYGESKGNDIYNPNEKLRTELDHDEYRKASTVINHFYEKLLLLKYQMNTTEGRRLAQICHQFILDFLKEFKAEY